MVENRLPLFVRNALATAHEIENLNNKIVIFAASSARRFTIMNKFHLKGRPYIGIPQVKKPFLNNAPES
jgi:hypothetical protein